MTGELKGRVYRPVCYPFGKVLVVPVLEPAALTVMWFMAGRKPDGWALACIDADHEDRYVSLDDSDYVEFALDLRFGRAVYGTTWMGKFTQKYVEDPGKSCERVWSIAHRPSVAGETAAGSPAEPVIYIDQEYLQRD